MNQPSAQYEPRICRDPDAAVQRRHDLIVVGGGIHGVMIALEAARRGLRPLLLERRDFGGAASWSSLRIVHGGLRYLQSLDLPRFMESVRERRWFFQHMPDQVRSLRCMMPLYGRGLKRTSTFGAALALNDMLARTRNRGVAPHRHLPGSRIIGVQETVQAFPRAGTAGLQGAGVWHDGVMVSPQRLLMELLRWACACGATALNYVQAGGLVVESGKTAGIEAVDVTRSTTLRFAAPLVINAAGLWCDELAQTWSTETIPLTHPSLAYNLMLDRPPVADAAVAVTPDRPGAPTYFLVPWGERTFAGTVHLPFDSRPIDPQPPAESICAFLADLNLAIPGFDATPEHVVRVHAGLLPATAPGASHTLQRPMLIDHARRGGPLGVVTMCGIKYTTARLVAEQTLRLALGRALPPYTPAPRPDPVGALDFDVFHEHAPLDKVRALMEAESVVHPDDLLLRRTDWGADPRRMPALRDWVLAVMTPSQAQLALAQGTTR